MGAYQEDHSLDGVADVVGTYVPTTLKPIRCRGSSAQRLFGTLRRDVVSGVHHMHRANPRRFTR